MTIVWKMHRPNSNGEYIFSGEALEGTGPGFVLAAEDGKGPALASAPMPRTLRRWPDLVSLEPLVRAAAFATYVCAIGMSQSLQEGAARRILRELERLDSPG